MILNSNNAGVRVAGVLLALVSVIAGVSSARANLKSSLTIEVNGFQNQKGQICLKLFASSKGFPNGNEGGIKRQCSKISENPMSFTFNNLTSGSYAVAVYHDRNGDGKLNRNSLGMPTEGFGLSRNPIVRQRAPGFGDCVFLVAGPNTSIQIQLRYSAGS
jgi:uncharacterized protein (DUF2141 family)